MAHRILIVDDETDILEFVGYNLEKEGYEVFTATNGQEGIEAALEHRPHLILLDMMMPVKDGIQTCRELRAHPETADTRIVFLSALGEEEYQLSGFEVGADDYIAKPIKMALLRSRINAIVRRIDEVSENGSGNKTENGVDSDTLAIDRERCAVRSGSGWTTLPRKEFMLFELLCSSPGKVFTREEIFERVWGRDVVVGDRTIDVHIRRLRRKLGSGRIETVKGFGYKFIEEPNS